MGSARTVHSQGIAMTMTAHVLQALNTCWALSTCRTHTTSRQPCEAGAKSYPFHDEKTEAQRGSWTCSKSQSGVWGSWYSNPGCLAVNEAVDAKVNRDLGFKHSRQGLLSFAFCATKGHRAPLPTLAAWAQDHSLRFHSQGVVVLGAWDTHSHAKPAPSRMRGFGEVPLPP